MTTTHATGCICGSHLLEDANEGTCLKCGHGDPDAPVDHAYRLCATRARGPGEHRPTYDRIRALFGGWPAFKQAIAETPCPRKPRAAR